MFANKEKLKVKTKATFGTTPCVCQATVADKFLRIDCNDALQMHESEAITASGSSHIHGVLPLAPGIAVLELHHIKSNKWHATERTTCSTLAMISKSIQTIIQY